MIDHAAVSGIAPAMQGAIQAYVTALWEALVRPAQAGIRLEGVDMGRLVRDGASSRGLAYQIALLTPQRREEVAGMRWSELSADLATWEIPAKRMKNNKPHDVSLTGRRVTMLH